MAGCFENDLVIFTISEYLPGEYVLRVFPLICKSTQSRRFSLSLLGWEERTGERKTSAIQYFDLEGPIYGINSIWRDFQRVLLGGHSIYAFAWEADLSNLTRIVFPKAEALHISSSFATIENFSGLFRRLAKLEVKYLKKQDLEFLWKLPLTSLSITRRCSDLGDVVIAGPPAFAQTLRTLHTTEGIDRNCRLLDLLAPHCQSLQDFSNDNHHEIIANNPGLTSLAITRYTNEILDLTRHTELVELATEGTVTSESTHAKLLSLSVWQPHLAKRFLARCPGLKHFTVCRFSWDNLLSTIELLPTGCRLNLFPSEPTPLAQVENLIKRGFNVNEELLLNTSDGCLHWTRILGLAPQFHSWKVFPCVKMPLLPDTWTSFPHLCVIDLKANGCYTQQVSSILISCPGLRELKCWGSQFSGSLQLESMHSLRKLSFNHLIGLTCSQLKLKFPCLTHLSLTMEKGGGGFLANLLDGNSNIHLPLLRVLSMNCFNCDRPPDNVVITCKTGHGSLSKLAVDWHHVPVAEIHLRKLPNLRNLSLSALDKGAHVRVDLPGDCDITVGNLDNYSRCGYSDRSNIVMDISHNGQRWVGKEVQQKVEATKRRKFDHNLEFSRDKNL